MKLLCCLGYYIWPSRDTDGPTCGFDNTICDYYVSNTSTSFEFAYVFDIESVGKLVSIFTRTWKPTLRSCISSPLCTVTVGDWRETSGTRIQMFPINHAPSQYPGHPLTSVQNFPEIIPGEPLHRGLNARGVAKYSDFRHIEGYIWETVQDTASSI